MVSAVVAVDNNWGIGYKGELLEKVSEDMRHFKELTSGLGKVVVMGRKTWDSLPIKPLPNRSLNFVITRDNNKSVINGSRELYLSVEQANYLMDFWQGVLDFYIIGGGQIYKQFLPRCEKIYVTKFFKTYQDVDTFFPNLDNMPEWQLVETSDIKKEKDLSYQFCLYERVY